MRVIIIGGGAAGFFAAITCATVTPETEVILLEAGKQPLAKVRISGGGRCNVTHHCFDPRLLVQAYPRGGKALRGAFTRFQPQDTVNWFESRGVPLKTEADGRMFPVTDNSETIINCLVNEAKAAGVKVKTGVKVKGVSYEDGQFMIELKNGDFFRSDRALLATGSQRLSYQWLTQLGHKIIPPIPSLFTFNIKDERLADLAGVSVENVDLKLETKGKEKYQQSGQLLMTHWGLSGPAVLKLSAYGARVLYNQNYQIGLIINWLPEENLETIKTKLSEQKAATPRRQIMNFSPVGLPRRLWEKLAIASGIAKTQRWAELSKKQLMTLAKELTQGYFKIQGKGVFKEEFVTCGGIDLKEVNFKTMESKLVPGLYFAGEILDIDGITGGFNFQNAWTTGWLAGQAMGE
ncbi:HI0933 family protein [Halothece sp. PCC 7418]|uniref:NAD(P)/FAD-dependent oxidoreductase n=1 Tax=Halothece sp. (strain PCC 7418) TaxID=65093 RepID=UPI0002A0742D|nr:NAD(P)/FAD-dependent oxidoreductase [Halothece sp. PCC 7418]AFZ42356.1 HI0933 family protein [Halothece sp. PCC 7418]